MSSRESIRWTPPTELRPVEERMIRRMTRTGRLYAFLRLHRHELFTDEFESALAEMYRDSRKGRPPVPPAMLVLVTLLQAYTGTSDAEAVHKALFDRRWQMVLDCLDVEDTPPFSQGLLAEFRFRLIASDLDRELVRRTVELAKETGDFGYKQLRVALDSAPIWGAGRVEDTFNLIGRALLHCVRCAANLTDVPTDDLVTELGLEVVGKSSVKAALDIDWDDAQAKSEALERLLADVAIFRAWNARHVRSEAPEKRAAYEALDEATAQLDRLVDQDIEPDPERNGKHRIIDGTAKDRQVSVGDAEMRHGRKSKATTIEGYKGHIAYDLDHDLVLDGLAEPANRREYAAADTMRPNIEFFGPIGELHIDRGFLAADMVIDLDRQGVPVFSKPWNHANGGLYPKSAFAIDFPTRTVTCPAGEVASFPSKRQTGGRRQVTFKTCGTCTLRDRCTMSVRGRSLVLHEDEVLLQRLQASKQTAHGRAQLRQRVAVEHALAHVLVYAPHEARYLGSRKNTFAIRRAGAIVNLQAIDRLAQDAA